MQACVLSLSSFYSAYARKENTTFTRESSIFVFLFYFAACQALPEPDISPAFRLSMTGFAFFKIGLKGL